MSINQQEIATPDKVCKRSITKTVVYIATMVAISIVLKMISNTLSGFMPPFLKLSLTYLGWHLSAAILGPYYGCAVACASDIIGQWLIPTGGAPNPILMAGNGLNALIFGMCFKYVKFKKVKPFISIVLASLIGCTLGTLVCTLGINTFGLWYSYHRATQYWAFLLTRLPQIPMVIANLVLFIAIIPVLEEMELIPSYRQKA